MNQKKLKDNTNKDKIYKGSIDCLLKVNKLQNFLNFFHKEIYLFYLKTIRTEGVVALYKGFLPSYIRLAPWNIIVNFQIYFYRFLF